MSDVDCQKLKLLNHFTFIKTSSHIEYTVCQLNATIHCLAVITQIYVNNMYIYVHATPKQLHAYSIKVIVSDWMIRGEAHVAADRNVYQMVACFDLKCSGNNETFLTWRYFEQHHFIIKIRM